MAAPHEYLAINGSSNEPCPEQRAAPRSYSFPHFRYWNPALLVAVVLSVAFLAFVTTNRFTTPSVYHHSSTFVPLHYAHPSVLGRNMPVSVPTHGRGADFGCYSVGDSGPCMAYFPRYYYDKNQQNCVPFVYGGCVVSPGFGSYQECMAAECG